MSHQGSCIIYTYCTCACKEPKCLSESYFCEFVALMDAWLLRQGFCCRNRIERTFWSSNNSWRWSSTRSGPSLRNSICLKKVIYGLQYLLMDKIQEKKEIHISLVCFSFCKTFAVFLFLLYWRFLFVFIVFFNLISFCSWFHICFIAHV